MSSTTLVPVVLVLPLDNSCWTVATVTVHLVTPAADVTIVVVTCYSTVIVTTVVAVFVAAFVIVVLDLCCYCCCCCLHNY